MNDDDLDSLAAEYMLGTLDHDERVRAQALLDGDPSFLGKVRIWERRLGELHMMVEPVEPPSQVWERVKRKLSELEPSSGITLPDMAPEAGPEPTPALVLEPLPAPGPEPAPAASLEPMPPPEPMAPPEPMSPPEPMAPPEPVSNSVSEFLFAPAQELPPEPGPEPAPAPVADIAPAQSPEPAPAASPELAPAPGLEPAPEPTPEPAPPSAAEPQPASVLDPASASAPESPPASSPEPMTGASPEPELAPTPEPAPAPSELTLPEPALGEPTPAATERWFESANDELRAVESKLAEMQSLDVDAEAPAAVSGAAPTTRRQSPVAPTAIERWLAAHPDQVPRRASRGGWLVAFLMMLVAVALGSLIAAWRFVPDRLPPELRPSTVLNIPVAPPAPVRPPLPPGSQFDE